VKKLPKELIQYYHSLILKTLTIKEVVVKREIREILKVYLFHLVRKLTQIEVINDL
jgi:hypothetical protein